MDVRSAAGSSVPYDVLGVSGQNFGNRYRYVQFGIRLCMPYG
jgi:hypothetical protein